MTNQRVVVFGSVKSSDVVLRTLIAANVNVIKVYALDESVSANVSGYYPIHNTASEYGISYSKFVKINAPEIKEELNILAPDYIFVVGLSQLISEDIINAAKEGTIGLHPAPLPKYRGRAAMVWQMLLGEKQSAVTFFFIDSGMDSGDIIVQEPFTIEDTDYAIDMDKKGLVALEKGMKKVAEYIYSGNVPRIKQDESKATYLLKRTPEDGQINWNESIYGIHKLVRAVSHPYPGAYSYYDGIHKTIIWRADIQENKKYIGFNGQIAELNDDYIDVVCKDGILHITDWEVISDEVPLRKMYVGHKFK